MTQKAECGEGLGTFGCWKIPSLLGQPNETYHYLEYPEVHTALERVDAGCMTKHIPMAIHICVESDILQKMRIRDNTKKPLMKICIGC